MQQLEYRDRDNQPVEKHYPIPRDALGVNLAVQDDEHNEAVNLIVDGKNYSLTIQGARNLAQALRMSANRVEQDKFDRMGKRSKGGHR